MLDRTLPPPIKDAVDFRLDLKPYDKYVLANGAEVYAIDAGAEDVLQLEWVFFSGNSWERKNLVAATTNYLLKNGTAGKTAFAINEHFEYHGSYLNRTCYNETATVTLHTLTKHLEALLPVVREILTESTFPEEELRIYQQNMKQRLNVNLKKCDYVAGRLIDSYLYGEGHPYGRYSRYEDFDALTREDLVRFYEDYYRNGHFIIFVAGRLPQNLQGLLNRFFGDLPRQVRELPRVHPIPAVEKSYRVINDPQGVQGAVRMGTPFPDRKHPDFVKALVLNNLFGGFFGSRLMSNIREEKGYTYGIYSYVQNHMQDTAWLVSTEAGRDVCEATITEVYKEMEGLCADPVPPDELRLVQNYMMGSILGDLDGPFQIINRWKNIILNGLGTDYFNRQIETIRAVTPAELQTIAQKYLKKEAFYELVVV